MPEDHGSCEAMPSETKKPFKVCVLCGHVWETREQFLSDPDIKSNGYQPNFEVYSTGVFLFTHHARGCDTALAVEVTELADLYSGPIFPEQRPGGTSCPGYCLHKSAVRPCINDCECAFIRMLTLLIAEWPKAPR